MYYKHYTGSCFEEPLDGYGASKLRRPSSLRQIDAQRRIFAYYDLHPQTKAIKKSRKMLSNLKRTTLCSALIMTVHSNALFKDSPYGRIGGFVLDAVPPRSRYIDNISSLGEEGDVGE